MSGLNPATINLSSNIFSEYSLLNSYLCLCLSEIIENIDHPWFVGVQFHPEYKSSVYNPHPIFVNFVKASLKKYLNK